ncbi:hypothetical protein, partial [Streptomyces sp. NPDC088141]|uniref:hypothetical protein n=1 Tax=Streptomyces sp. NPDC088141 TaxID=3155179 RepID=UPI00341E4DBC
AGEAERRVRADAQLHLDELRPDRHGGEVTGSEGPADRSAAGTGSAGGAPYGTSNVIAPQPCQDRHSAA